MIKIEKYVYKIQNVHRVLGTYNNIKKEKKERKVKTLR